MARSMKRLLLLVLLALLSLAATGQTVSYLGVRQDIIVDVRTPAEFRAGHIANAVNIPLDRLGSGIHAIPGIKKNSHILLYCRSGRRSAIARDTLIKQGFLYVQDGGGMTALEPQLKACSTLRC
ncbi:MAG: rhodanese-like domain-containing protein [Oxalobacter sp.]|nr:MAG: rhodanese-like domain-containing protein [Oxalobacter sp.]